MAINSNKLVTNFVWDVGGVLDRFETYFRLSQDVQILVIECYLTCKSSKQ
jgi:hypothetical protein